MIKETILSNFSTWDSEKQLSEYQKFKALGSFSPLNEPDYDLMERIMNNTNAEISVEYADSDRDIVGNNTLIEAAPGVGKAEEAIDDKEKSKKIIYLLDILFDDAGSSDVLPDIDKLKAPTLLSALKGLITDLSKSSDNKESLDVFFDKNEKKTNKRIDDSILKLISATKLDKIKFSKNNQIGKFLSKYTNETGTITFNDLLSIPVIKMIVYLASTGRKSLTNKEKVFVFDSDKIDIIKSNKSLNKKVETFSKKIGQVLMKVFEGVDKYDADRIKAIDASDMSDEEKDLQKLKAIGAEEDEKETPGKKIAAEIEKTSSDNKRTLVLTKMGYNADNIKEILTSISTTKELVKTDTNLTKSNVVSDINIRWKELVSINSDLASKLYNKKFAGEGKGERLIEFLFPSMTVNGGGTSFDLKGSDGSDNFEVKAYTFSKDIVHDIKLGVEGKATQSTLFNDIQLIVTQLQSIFSKPNHYEVLKNMITGLDSDAEGELEKLVKSISGKLTTPVPNTQRTFKEALAAGEFAASAITHINILLTELRKLFEIIKDNEFFYMKVIGKRNEIYKIKNMDDKSSTEFTIFNAVKTEITKEDENELISSILDIIGNKNLSKHTTDFFTRVIDELEGIINKDFPEHPMILMYDTGTNVSDGDSSGITKFDNIVNGLYEKFRVVRITRGNVSIMPTEHFNKKYGTQ